MKMNRGPPGYSIIRAPFNSCETEVSIDKDGFFTYTNFLYHKNGTMVNFKCQSSVNSKTRDKILFGRKLNVGIIFSSKFSINFLSYDLKVFKSN